MSFVTDVILTTAFKEPVANFSPVLKYLADNQHKGTFRKVSNTTDSEKAIQTDVYLAAFNYLRHDEFVAAFQSCKFDSPEEAQLFLKGEHDTVFKMYYANDKYEPRPEYREDDEV